MINFVKLYLPLVPFSVFSIWQQTNVKNMDQLNDPKLVSLVLIVNLAYLIIYLWVWIAGVLAIKFIINNLKFTIKDLYKEAWGLVWKFSLLSLLLLFITIGGLLLLIIPAIIFGVWFSFSKFIFLDKKSSIRVSLRKSKNLVEGKFWAILGRYVVFGLFTGLFGIVLAILPFGIGGIITTVFGVLFVLPYYLLYLELAGSYKNK